MAKINIIKNNFTSGELSPHIWLRTDLNQYKNGCKEVFNMLPIVEGGIKRRGGTEAIAQTKDAVRLIPFVLSHTEAFILIFKSKQIEILDVEGKVIKTLEAIYTEQDIPEINYIQNRHQLYLVHPKHPVQWLRTSEDLTNWSIDEFQYSVPPLEETDTPLVALLPSEKGVGKTCTLTASLYEVYQDTKQYLVGSICWYTIKGEVKYFKAKRITQGNAPTLGSVDKPHEGAPTFVPDPNWEEVSVGATEAFKESDVGKYVFINEGIVRIDSYVSTSVVTGEVLLKLNADIEAIANSWVMKDKIFSENLGYPRAVSMYQQRLILGGTKTYQNYIWLSRVGDFSNFLPTVQDGDSFTISASSEQLNNVLHISQSRGVVVHTGGSELAINATNALTPTNANILEHTAYGITANIRPIKVGSELLFVQRGAERLRTLVYDYSQDGLVSNELTVLASHIAEEHGGFKEMTYQQEPDSVIWFTLNDGTLATLTLNREQSVTSWARHDIGARVLSSMTLPSSTGNDRLYFLVDRNGTKQVEQLKEELLLDSVLRVPVQHNKPCVVQNDLISILGDDVAAYFDNGVETYSLPILKRVGNTLTIDCDMTVDTIFIGRKFRSKVSLFAPELQNTPMTTSPSLFKINHINLYMYKSLNPKVNGEMIEMKEFNSDLFAAPKPFTGHKRIEMNGWNTFDNFKLEIEQDEPLPFHITAVVLEHNFNER